MGKGASPIHFQLDDRRVITTTAKAGSTSLAEVFHGQKGISDFECIERGLEIILIIRNPWRRLYSTYRYFMDKMSPAEYIDYTLISTNPHSAPQTEQHPFYDKAVRLEAINDWWPRREAFPLANWTGGLPEIKHRKADCAERFAQDLTVWETAHGC